MGDCVRSTRKECLAGPCVDITGHMLVPPGAVGTDHSVPEMRYRHLIDFNLPATTLGRVFEV